MVCYFMTKGVAGPHGACSAADECSPLIWIATRVRVNRQARFIANSGEFPDSGRGGAPAVHRTWPKAEICCTAASRRLIGLNQKTSSPFRALPCELGG